MSDLSDSIDAFLAKYPDDAELVWKHPQRRPRTAAEAALRTAVGDLVAASERLRGSAS